jgi:hypothetical protein
VAFGNAGFVGVGPRGTFAFSSDGSFWQTQSISPTNIDWFGVAYGDGHHVAVGPAGVTARSENGFDWYPINPTGVQLLQSITHGAGQFVAVGRGRRDPNAYCIYTSTEGMFWSNRLSGTGFSLRGITYGSGVFVAVGTRGKIYSSVDAITWTPRVSPNTNILFHSVAFGNGRYVATGTLTSNSVACHSFDGQNWSAPSLVATYTFTAVSPNVVFGEGAFIVATATQFPPNLGKATLYSSLDGVTWQLRHVRPDASDQVTGLAYGNGTFVAVSPTGLILQTPDVRPNLQWRPCDDPPGWQLVLGGYSNALYAIETSTNLMQWARSSTNRVLDAEVEIFKSPMKLPGSYYRAVFLPD